MKTYTIISTYPTSGSKNIGDNLITEATKSAIRKVKGDDIRFNVVWRADTWDNVKDQIENSDAVIFACLAIRHKMSEIQYPYLNKIIPLRIPLGVISAGTNIDVSRLYGKFYSDFSKRTIHELTELNDKALFFTTRGVLTQRFCSSLHLSRVKFSGDIAFFDERFNDRKFPVLEKDRIREIAISDPHYPKHFMQSADNLVNNLRRLFPQARISFLIHGVNPDVENYCRANNVQFLRIYEDIENGLDNYDRYDMHVGFRVHGHVSSLKRRIPSYLLEQDGRGCDYGLTIGAKISVANYHNKLKDYFKPSNLMRYILDKPVKGNKSELAVEMLLSIIQYDFEYNTTKFLGLENQIEKFNLMCCDTLKQLP